MPQISSSSIIRCVGRVGFNVGEYSTPQEPRSSDSELRLQCNCSDMSVGRFILFSRSGIDGAGVVLVEPIASVRESSSDAKSISSELACNAVQVLLGRVFDFRFSSYNFRSFENCASSCRCSSYHCSYCSFDMWLSWGYRALCSDSRAIQMLLASLSTHS